MTARVYEFKPRPAFEEVGYDDSIERSLLEDDENTWYEDQDGTRYPPGHPRNPLTGTWLDDTVGCSVCWFGHELDFDAAEFGVLPVDLDAGIAEMLRGYDVDPARPHAGHRLLPMAAQESAADAAEFIASWRHTNTGPTRPRVVAAMRQRGDDRALYATRGPIRQGPRRRHSRNLARRPESTWTQYMTTV